MTETAQTPRTDAVSRMAVGPYRETAILEFARTLERELEAARKALEFGEYMAKAAEGFLQALEQADASDGSYDWRADAFRSLTSGIYEFRKRAALTGE